MLVMLMCHGCNNLNQLDTIECSFCESNLIGENVELHAEYEPGIISATNLFVEHNPLGADYVENLTRATENEVERQKEKDNKKKNKPQYSASADTLYFICSNSALILETMGYDVSKFNITMGVRKASDQLLIEASQEPEYEFSPEDELWASEMLDTIIEAISRFSDFYSIYEFIFSNLLELEDWMHPDEKPTPSGAKLSDLLAEINATILAANSGSPYTWVNEHSTTHTQVGVIAHFCLQAINQLKEGQSDKNNDKLSSINSENNLINNEKAEFKLFKPLPSETSDEILINEGIPRISSLFGTSEMAEHLGAAVQNGHNGSINAHININAKFLGGGFQVSEKEAREMIEAWIKKSKNRQFSNDQEVGYAFLSEVITKIVD